MRPRDEGKFPAKTPYTFTGFKEATLDEATIRAWWAKWPEALVGCWAGESGLVALDIDMDDDADAPHDGWFSIGSAGVDVPDTFHYSTRRGGDHYIYLAPEGVHLGPTQDHATPEGEILEDIDRRGGGSYWIWWGATVPGDRSAFMPAPDWLLTPAADAEQSPYSGSVEEWVARCAKGEPSALIEAWIASIPPEFGHNVMIEGQRHLVALAVEGEVGVPMALEVFRSAWLAGEWGTNKYARDWNLGLKGAIERFGAFPPGPRDIGLGDAYIQHANSMRSEGFLEVWTGTPPSGSKEAMRERVAYVASVALSEGLSALDAANIAWTSKAARQSIRTHLPDDEAKVEVWNVVIEALSRPTEQEAIHAKDEPAPVDAPDKPKRGVELLTARERAALSGIRSAKWGDGYRWWGDQFMAVMEEIHSVMSEPYYRLNRWLILSLIFANRAVIELESGSKVILNFYAISLGPSNSGKSEALEPVLEMSRLFYEASGDNPDIGGDATAAALTQALIRRDGLTSLFHSDEADAVLLNWGNQNGEFRGMKQRITEIWGGRVPAIQRAMQKDISGIHARAYLNTHLIGIDDKIGDAISPDDWRSGFINRFVWANGERKYLSDDMRRLRLRKAGSVLGKKQPNWYGEWANRLRIYKNHIGVESEPGPTGLDIAEDVLERDVELQKRLDAIAIHSGAYEDRVDPTLKRLRFYALKCAALVALSEDRRTVQMSDYLIALEQIEEWAENALEMVRRTDLSPRARQVNRLASIIQSKGGRMEKSSIYREEAYAGDSRGAEGLIKELEAQKRAEVVVMPGAEPIVRLIEVAA